LSPLRNNDNNLGKLFSFIEKINDDNKLERISLAAANRAIKQPPLICFPAVAVPY
jgi:hypothetical protein